MSEVSRSNNLLILKIGLCIYVSRPCKKRQEMWTKRHKICSVTSLFGSLYFYLCHPGDFFLISPATSHKSF